MNQRVAVIGAGVAGLCAARTLLERGRDVVVFDKARGVGGRASVRRAAPFAFDHGAQYFTVRDERFARVVATWRTAGVVTEWAGRIAVLCDGVTRFSDSTTRYVGVPTMNAITRALADGLDVVLRTRIEQVTPVGNTWQLLRDDGTDLGRFDSLVLALPAPQAAALLAGQSPLASQADACELTPCWAVMLGFAGALAAPFDGAFVHQSPLTWIARNSAKPARPTPEAWVLHASPGWSAQHVADDPAQVVTALTTEFLRLVDEPGRQPAFSTAHRWRYAQPPAPLDVGCLWQASAGLAVCGDWCQGARIEGAYLSGLAAAERVLGADARPAAGKTR